ncbi:ABC transporter ATP-binding protein [soil metagenome]
MDLTLEHLSVTLARREVLRDISVTLKPGRITALLGPNGAGKSTLVKAVAALVPAQGHALLGDRDVAALDPRERARLIGYLPQDGIVAWNLPAAEAVMLGRLPHRSPFAGPSPADLDAVLAAMEATETTHLADRPLDELSGGERARVLLARVLAGEPRWLLADEPLAALDPAHQLDILARLRARADAGLGVVLVLHDLVQAGRAADDVLLLKEGRAFAFGPAAEILTAENLRHVFDIAVATATAPDGRILLVPVGR